MATTPPYSSRSRTSDVFSALKADGSHCLVTWETKPMVQRDLATTLANMPSVQVYTPKMVAESVTVTGAPYRMYDGFSTEWELLIHIVQFLATLSLRRLLLVQQSILLRLT